MLLHPETLARTVRAIDGCNIVAYTSIDVVGSHPTIVGPTGCVLVYVGEDVERIANPAWTYILHRRTNFTRLMSRRKFSKIPKLNPHLLFGVRKSVFWDSKLHVRISLTILDRLLANRQFVAFRHPNLCSTCDAFTWMSKEATMVTSRVSSVDTLNRQVQRYLNASPTRSCRTYIDAALLLQRDARRIFSAWSDEFFRWDSSDRDQISFAYVVAKTCANVTTINGCQRIDTMKYCHWWHRNSNVATLHRTNLDRPFLGANHMNASASRRMNASASRRVGRSAAFDADGT